MKSHRSLAALACLAAHMLAAFGERASRGRAARLESRVMRAPVVAALALLLATPLAAQEERLLYAWTTPDGGVHYTDDPERVPAEHRATMKTLVATERVAPAAAAAPRVPAARPEVAEEYDGWGEAQWRAEAARLDALLAELGPKAKTCETDHLNLSAGDGSRKRREERAEAEACAQARDALAQARADREALSERAHRAGAPPGWVRGE